MTQRGHRHAALRCFTLERAQPDCAGDRDFAKSGRSMAARRDCKVAANLAAQHPLKSGPFPVGDSGDDPPDRGDPLAQ